MTEWVSNPDNLKFVDESWQQILQHLLRNYSARLCAIAWLRSRWRWNFSPEELDKEETTLLEFINSSNKDWGYINFLTQNNKVIGKYQEQVSQHVMSVESEKGRRVIFDQLYELYVD